MAKKVLITGCSSDIGKSITNIFLDNGYEVIGTYNTNIEKNIKSYKVDLTNEKEIDSLVKKVGNIDILINNAALSLDSPVEEKTKEEFMNVLDVNLVAPFLLIKKLNPSVVVNIASTDGINTYSNLNVDYSASKAGLINLTKSLALENKFKIYAICPNWVNTSTIKNMNQDYLKSEMKRVHQRKLIDPDEVAKQVFKLASGNKKSGYIKVMR